MSFDSGQPSRNSLSLIRERLKKAAANLDYNVNVSDVNSSASSSTATSTNTLFSSARPVLSLLDSPIAKERPFLGNKIASSSHLPFKGIDIEAIAGLGRNTQSYSALPSVDKENEKLSLRKTVKPRDSMQFHRKRLPLKKPVLPDFCTIAEQPVRPASESRLLRFPQDSPEMSREVMTEPNNNNNKDSSRATSRDRSGLTVSKSSMSLCSSKEDLNQDSWKATDTKTPNVIIDAIPIGAPPVQNSVHELKEQRDISPPPRPKSSANSGYGESGYMTSASVSAYPHSCVTPARSMPSLNESASKQRDKITVNGRVYEVLNILGTGGSSKVYQAFDSATNMCVAIKCVDLSEAEPMIRRAYQNEIKLLSKLQTSERVIKLHEYELRGDNLLVVMEKGDTDLSVLLKTKRAEIMNDPLMIKFYWAEMLKAVQVIHSNGVIHSDLKPSNFLLVGGNLKLIDFGIASAISNNKTGVTQECQMGTLNYMSPECLKNAGNNTTESKFRVTLKTDVWSLGCILYSLCHGKTPFAHIPNGFSKMYAITSEEHTIKFKQGLDPLLLQNLKICLQRDPLMRPSVDKLLQHAYLNTVDKKMDHLKSAESVLNALNLNSPTTKDRIIKQILEANKK